MAENNHPLVATADEVTPSLMYLGNDRPLRVHDAYATKAHVAILGLDGDAAVLGIASCLCGLAAWLCGNVTEVILRISTVEQDLFCTKDANDAQSKSADDGSESKLGCLFRTLYTKARPMERHVVIREV